MPARMQPCASQSPPHAVALVEDEAVLREEMAFQLRHFGFEVACFATAAALLEHLRHASPDSVVLDVGLDGEDGLSLCARLRLRDPELRIVFVTARALHDERRSGLRAGANAYLVKPIDLDELVRALRDGPAGDARPGRMPG